MYDWNAGIHNSVPTRNELELTEAARKAFEASPMASVDSWRSPGLVMHGDGDRNVDFCETVTLVEVLRARKAKVEQPILPDKIRRFLLCRHWCAPSKVAPDFFDFELPRVLKRKRFLAQRAGMDLTPVNPPGVRRPRMARSALQLIFLPKVDRLGFF